DGTAMHLPVILRILGLLLMLFSLTHVPPLLVSLYYGDGSAAGFGLSLLLTLAAGVCCWWPFHRSRQELRTRDCFLVVTLFWSVLGSFGAVPLLLAPGLSLGITDAVFESMSGLTTTGATVLDGLDELP